VGGREPHREPPHAARIARLRDAVPVVLAPGLLPRHRPHPQLRPSTCSELDRIRGRRVAVDEPSTLGVGERLAQCGAHPLSGSRSRIAGNLCSEALHDVRRPELVQRDGADHRQEHAPDVGLVATQRVPFGILRRPVLFEPGQQELARGPGLKRGPGLVAAADVVVVREVLLALADSMMMSRISIRAWWPWGPRSGMDGSRAPQEVSE
jgi:hypothetical protein